MGLLQRLIRGTTEETKEYKMKFKQAEQDMKIMRTLEERQKSANERELEAHMKRLREDDIKSKLDTIRKQEGKELWKGKHNILDKGTSILKNDRPMLKEKNIFKNNPNQFSKKHAIKHKTDMGFFK